LRVLNETLGEGEVSAIVQADHEIRVQETVFSGVWRQQHLRGTHLLHDYLLAAPIPPVVQAWPTKAPARGCAPCRCPPAR
jgi:hydrogenase-1 operon protein HyaF